MIISSYKKQTVILMGGLMLVDRNEYVTRREYDRLKDKMRRRMNLLEDRLEKIDGIKQLRQDWADDNGLPIA